MNNITLQFIEKYDREHPDFAFRVCAVADLYDSDLDMFHIEEVQDMSAKNSNKGWNCE